VGVILGLASSGASGAAPPCVARVDVRPKRAVVGQQVVYTARLLRRPDVSQAAWAQAPSFPSFRAERLSGLMGQQRVRENDAAYLVYEERRALFPAHAGRLEIPAARLDCVLYAPPGARGETAPVTLPGAFVEVEAVPEAGRPEGWSGVVGRLEAASGVEPDRVALGGSVRVVVVLRGEANLWDATSPLAAGRGIEGAEVFARPPRLELEGAERLRVRRLFEYELVPRRAGSFAIPDVAVPYFDPETGRYGVASAPALRITVDAGAAGAPEAAAAPAHPAPPRESRPSAGAGAAERFARPLAGAAAGLAAALAFVLWRRRRARPARANAAGAHLARANDAAARRDAAGEESALGAALRVALATRLGVAAEGATAEELAARARARADDAAGEAAALLGAAERARFAPPGSGESAPSPERLRAALGALARG
jgi:hypothetical protein